MKIKDNNLYSELLLNASGCEHYSTLRNSDNVSGTGVWMPHQVHGSEVVVLTDSNMQIVDADAVITDLKGQLIGVRTADCVPVLMYDPIENVVAAVHAGWRGMIAHIIKITVARMKSEYGCSAENVLAAVCPSISPEAFEVGDEVAQQFDAEFPGSVLRTFSKPHVDLWQSAVMDLVSAGLDLEHIDCTPVCTMSNPELFSARRETINTGRNISAIKLL